MGRLRKYIRPYYAYIFLAVVIKLSGALLELWIPDLMEKMLDLYVPLGEKRGIWLCGGGMVLCAAGCLVLNIIANRMSAVSSGKITKALRHDLFAKLEQPLSDQEKLKELVGHTPLQVCMGGLLGILTGVLCNLGG